MSRLNARHARSCCPHSARQAVIASGAAPRAHGVECTKTAIDGSPSSDHEEEQKADAQLRQQSCTDSADEHGIVRLTAADRTVGESQRTSATGTAYDLAGWDPATAELTVEAVDLGARVFMPLAKRQSLPGRAHATAAERFLVDRPRVLGFLGVGGRDLARLLHLVLVPAFSAIAASPAMPSDCRWVFDLKPAHAPLLREMRDAGLDFLRANEAWFAHRYGGLDIAEDLLHAPLDTWLQEERVQFGFHARPSVGYLHLHMLVGPLTEYGASDEYRRRWVPLTSVLEALDAGNDASALLELDDASL